MLLAALKNHGGKICTCDLLVMSQVRFYFSTPCNHAASPALPRIGGVSVPEPIRTLLTAKGARTESNRLFGTSLLSLSRSDPAPAGFALHVQTPAGLEPTSSVTSTRCSTIELRGSSSK